MRLMFFFLAVIFFLTPFASAQQQEPAEPPLVPDDERQTPGDAPTSETVRLTRDDLETWLDGFLPYALQRGGVAGAVVAVVKDGEVLLQKGYGFADVEERVPVDAEQTLFRPGSVAKLFTWTAVMQLVEDDKIDLDRDVNTYLDFEIPAAGGDPVTMRDIMTHTAGFEERLKGLITSDPDNLEPLGDYLRRWVPDRIFPAGSTPAYSNYATGLAGYVVERVSGQSFDDYIEQRIFAPLDMTNSSFRQPLPPRLEEHMSKGYSVASAETEPYELVKPAPAGSLASTGADMAKFMIAHLQQGSYNGAQILKPATAREMHRTMLTMLPPLNRMALGFFETNTNGRQVIAHLGDTQWFHTALHLFIDDGIGLYLSVNSLGKEGAAGPIRSSLFEMFADRYLPGPEPSGSVDPELAAEHAAMIAGVYDNSRRSDSSFFAALNLMGQITVVDNADGTITIDGFDDLAGTPKVWREIAPFVWVEKRGEERLAARVEDGAVRRFSVDGLSPFMVFEPVRWWKSSAWLLPLFNASLAALVLTAVLWPVAAIVRWRFRVTLALSGADRQAYRWVKMAAIASVAVVAGWIGTVTAMSANYDLFSPKLDPWLLTLQVLSLVVFCGALFVGLWNAWRVWSGSRRWPAKIWSIVLVAAFLTVLWLALTFHLIGFGVNY